MKVLAHSPLVYHLLQDGEALYLDVNCNQGVFSSSITFELNLQETNQFQSQGLDYINQLAVKVMNNVSGFKSRDIMNPAMSQNIEAARKIETALLFFRD